MTNTAPAPCDGSATLATPNPTGGYTYTTCTGCPKCVRPNRSDRMRARIEAAGSAFVGLPTPSSDDMFGGPTPVRASRSRRLVASDDLFGAA